MIYIKRKEQYSFEYESYNIPEIDKDKIRKDIELIKNDKKVKNVTFNKDDINKLCVDCLEELKNK